jgi:putative transposase
VAGPTCPPRSPGSSRGRPVGAVLAEQNDEWTESRRYIGLEILAACPEAVQPDMGKNNTTEAGLTTEAIPA